MKPTAPSIKQPTSRVTSYVSLSLGISGLLITLVSYGFLLKGISFGLLSLAIILGVVGLILAIKAKRQLPRDKVRRAGFVTNIVSIALSIMSIASIGLIMILGMLFFGLGSTTSSPARAASLAQFDEQKTFAAGETAHIGAWDITVNKVVRNYQPTLNEYPHQTDKYSDLTETNDEFVMVKGTASSNGNTKAVYLEPGDIRLNGYRTAVITGGDGWLRRTSSSRSATNASDFSIIFRIKQGSTRLEMAYPVTVYEAISPIVGTEGMPSKVLTYTMMLN